MRSLKVNHTENIGNKYGRLTVVKIGSNGKDTVYHCLCECGNEKVATYSNLISGNTKSCGCWLRERGHLQGKSIITHAKSRTKEYRTWISMKRRCYAKNHKDYQWYGARGITVSDDWKDSFENFYADMGEAPEGMSIDRIDNEKGYEAGNCRWASKIQQANNRRPLPSQRFWNVHGDIYPTLSSAAKSLGVDDSTIRAWCLGRTAKGKFYPPKDGCSAEFMRVRPC